MRENQDVIRKIQDFLLTVAWPAPRPGADENRAKLDWMLRLRWLAILGEALLALLGLKLGYLSAHYLPLYGAILGAQALWNLVSWRGLLQRQAPISTWDLAIQFVADIGGLTLLISLSGGIYNPASALLLVHSVLAALLLERASLLAVLLLIPASLAFLQWDPDVSHLSITGNVTRPSIFVSYSVVGLFLAALTFWLSRTLRALEANVRTLRAQQERMDRLKVAGAVAAGFSHKFATPLSTLRLRLDRILRKGGVDTLDDASEARSAVRECEDILKQLTQTGLKADHLNLEKLCAEEVFVKWVEEFQSTHPDATIHLSETPAGATPIEVPRWPLRESVFDLIENAIEASDPGHPVTIHLAAAEGAFVVAIENRGPEIPALVTEKWGEPFVTTKPDGTGLGLYNALSLAQAIGGTLRALRTGAVTRIELSLPADPETP